MSHRNARPCGYADGLTLLVSGMLRGSRHRSSFHLKDFLRRAGGQGGGSGEDSGDSETGSGRRESEMRIERERELTVPCGPVTISRVCSVHREGWGLTQSHADWAAVDMDCGSDRK